MAKVQVDESIWTSPCVARSADHHDGIQERVCRIAVTSHWSRALNGSDLSLTQAKRHEGPVLDAIGAALQQTARAVPAGVLVFFPSYSFQEAALQHWTRTGLLQRLEDSKPVFVERKNMSGDAFQTEVNQYRAAAKTAPGALLLAVMRGKVSEGSDFRNDEARGTVVVGVPFPSLSTETRLIRNHREETFGAGAGNRWYEGEAYRQVSQAAGRLIRHSQDYGALVLLDQRYRNPSKLLSPWIRSGVVAAGPGQDLEMRLRAFFQARGAEVQLHHRG